MRGALVLAAVVVVGGVFYAPVWHGDAAIYLPYVRALAERGRWLEFNPGEISSGATSPLWVLWLLPWWATLGLTGFKLAGAVMVALAVGAAYGVGKRLGMSEREALMSAAAVAYCSAPAGFLGYETPLAALVGVAWMSQAVAASQQGWRIALLAALTPLVRPDMALLSAAYAGRAVVARRWSELVWLIGGSLVATAYYAAVHAATGSFSASSYCRSFALRETAVVVLGIAFHPPLLRELAWSGLGLLGIAAAVGLWGQRNRWHQGWWLFCAGCAISYGLFFTTVAPINTVRYCAPIAFAMSWAAREGIRWLVPRLRWRRWVLVGLTALLFLTLGARAWDDRRRGYSFELVTERECAEFLNAVAEPNAVVLAYEVQIRYWLRPDLSVLSLDGITDGKVAPYLVTGAVAEFLWRYRPRYWVANSAVWRRPFLRASLLRDVLESSDSVVVRAGIRFERLRAWAPERLPRGFYGCLAVYRLGYEERARWQR